MIVREISLEEIFAENHISELENSLQLINAEYEELNASKKKFLYSMAICSTLGISEGLSMGGEGAIFAALALGCLSGLLLPLSFIGLAHTPIFCSFSSRSSDVGDDISFSILGIFLGIVFCWFFGACAFDKKYVKYRELKNRKRFLEIKLDTYKKLVNSTGSC